MSWGLEQARWGCRGSPALVAGRWPGGQDLGPPKRDQSLRKALLDSWGQDSGRTFHGPLGDLVFWEHGSLNGSRGLAGLLGAAGSSSGQTARADAGFWSGGPSGVLTPVEALSPKFAQNRGFPLKLPEILRARGPGPQGPPGSGSGQPGGRDPCLSSLRFTGAGGTESWERKVPEVPGRLVSSLVEEEWCLGLDISEPQ